MTPYYADDWLTVYAGDCRAVLASMESESVHCVVTSPPYWGLRDYGTEGQLGLEPTPEQYVANMVAVFREVRRVLRDDGTLWLNLGDSYAGGRSGPQGASGEMADREVANHRGMLGTTKIVDGLKPKDLVGIPWRVAFALQADGWYLRSDIIWAKPNPMPESVTDRPTKSHEYLFLLAKSQRYYFDADAVREPHTREWAGEEGLMGSGRTDWATRAGRHDATRTSPPQYNPEGRNIRSVWTIPTQPYPGAHFAVFPPKLVEPCIKAGTSEKGVCPECGAPWERVTEHERTRIQPHTTKSLRSSKSGLNTNGPRLPATSTTTGWQLSCGCIEANGVQDGTPIPATLLDPFAGSGTVGMVAQSLSRRAVLIDLNPDYIDQQMRRNAQTPMGLTA